MLLFVYGTLLKGEENAVQLHGVPFIANDSTLPQYTLVNLGRYPGLLATGNCSVCGEVYEIEASMLPELDDFEDHPEVYIRTQIALASGLHAFTYVLRPEHAAGAPEIPSGQWRNR